ncbi:MAG: hypothetical protein HZB38_00205 [Planctomycetes bacterium]|nr:hypothetical protein [Planctomycetota bacterium]
MIARSSVLSLRVCCFLVGGSQGQIPTSPPTWLPAEYSYDRPFFENAHYDPAVQTPRQILGFDLGDRPVRHEELQRCLAAWASSPRIKLAPFGFTHERRSLVYAVITSPANHQRLADIQTAIGKLADPRKLRDDAEAQAIIRGTPAIAWMAYCIHGDEVSVTDGALAAMYHLLASTDPAVTQRLDKAVICFDPLQNPDGRDRFIAQCDQAGGYTPNLDADSVQHDGRWPYGRTNHYLFDMNRDWIYGTQPETRARQAAIAAWNPQHLIDGHEMGSDSTFLFYPPRDPFNPTLSPLIHKWWATFADEAGKAFDHYGWSYYTREWSDYWYPGYTDGWGTLNSAVSILYEQARTGGRAIRQPTGRILTYREAVHHQATATWSNLCTLAANREALLNDFLAQRRAALNPDAAQPRVFLLPPQSNATRRAEFVATLTNAGVELSVSSKAFTAENVASSLRETVEKREFPAGTVVVRRAQPRGAVVEALLGFDPRMDQAFLDSERKELETKKESRLYDVTAWSPVMAAALEAYWSQADITIETEPWKEAPAAAFPEAENLYAYAFDGDDDASVRAAAHLLQAGAVVRVADEEFRVDGRTLPRGSFLIRRHENAADWAQQVRDAAAATHATAYAARTARSPDTTPDLGGERFTLLRTPKVGLVGDGGGDTSTYGAIWNFLDCETRLSVSLLSGDLSRVDLRRFNVLIVPSPRGALRGRLDDVAAWIRAGGTLIAIGDAADHLADEKQKLSSVRRRQDVLKTLDEYTSAAALERTAGQTKVEVDKLWDDVVEHVPPGAATTKPDTKLTDEALDEWRRIFSPVGTILRGETSRIHWLTYGVGPELPLYSAGSLVLVSKSPVATPVRFADAKRLRMSGLLWPEAAVRFSASSYATVERIGAGQLILFAQDPIFRGAWRGTGRLLLNAVLLGPGCGTSQPNP